MASKTHYTSYYSEGDCPSDSSELNESTRAQKFGRLFTRKPIRAVAIVTLTILALTIIGVVLGMHFSTFFDKWMHNHILQPAKDWLCKSATWLPSSWGNLPNGAWVGIGSGVLIAVVGSIILAVKCRKPSDDADYTVVKEATT